MAVLRTHRLGHWVFDNVSNAFGLDSGIWEFAGTGMLYLQTGKFTSDMLLPVVQKSAVIGK